MRCVEKAARCDFVLVPAQHRKRFGARHEQWPCRPRHLPRAPDGSCGGCGTQPAARRYIHPPFLCRAPRPPYAVQRRPAQGRAVLASRDRATALTRGHVRRFGTEWPQPRFPHCSPSLSRPCCSLRCAPSAAELCLRAMRSPHPRATLSGPRARAKRHSTPWPDPRWRSSRRCDGRGADRPLLPRPPPPPRPRPQPATGPRHARLRRVS